MRQHVFSSRLSRYTFSKPWNAIGRSVPVAGQRQSTSPFSLCNTLPPPSFASGRRIGFDGSRPGMFSDNQDEKAHVARLGREGVARASQARGAGPTAPRGDRGDHWLKVVRLFRDGTRCQADT